MSDRGDPDINHLVQDIVDASKKPPKARITSIKPTVARLTSLAYERGVLADALAQLVDLVASPSYLDQASLASITRSLYPASNVSRAVTLRVLSALGHGRLKPSLNVQAALLRWLILVYHVLEAPSILSQAYSVLFNLLDTAATRPHVSHLLALITRRKHVRPFRIQLLLGLSRQTGNDPCLVGLLRVFKDYYPEIIVGDAVRGKASAFKHPDPQWRERLDEIQEGHLRHSQEGITRPRDGFRVNRPANRLLRSKIVPTVHTFHASESSVTLEEIESATGLVRSIAKIELPNQLAAVLADPLLQKLLLLRPNEQADRRVANWMDSVLQEVLDGDTDESTLWDVLDVVRDFVKHTKALPPLMLNFFVRFFHIWHGSVPHERVLDILSYAPFYPFQQLLEHIFQPLERSVADNTPETHRGLLDMFTKLLHHWKSILQSQDSPPSHTSSSLAALVQHVNPLALTVLQSSAGLHGESAVLDFYEQSARLTMDPKLISHVRIELPPGSIIYSMLFSGSLFSMSRMCHILAGYKKGFELAMSSSSRHDGSKAPDVPIYERGYVSLYNGYLMDMCNCFWRARALHEGDNSAHGCLIPRVTVSALASYVTSVDTTFSLGSLFSLSNSPLLCHQSIQAMRKLEDDAMGKDRSIRVRHAGPVTQSSLAELETSGGAHLSWHEYRLRVLEHLSAEGLTGVTELLKCTMTVLKKSIEGRAQKGS